MPIESRFLRLKRLVHNYRKEFYATTGKSIDYYLESPLLGGGFDIFKFMDEFFPGHMEAEKSCNEFITEKWSKEFSQKIEEML